MIKKIILFLTLSSFVFGQAEVREVEIPIETNEIKNVLEFTDYISKVKELLPEIKITEAQVSNAYLNIESARGGGDVNLSAEAGVVGRTGSYMDVPLNAAGLRWNVGAGSTILQTGTRWNVTISHDSYFQSDPKGALYTPALQLTLTQPILYNFLGKLDRYPIQDAEYSYSIATMRKKVSDSSVIAKYQKLFYEWILWDKNLQFIETMVKDAKSLESTLQSRMRNGLVDNDSYQNAVRQRLQYEDLYKQYKLNYELVKRDINYFYPIISGVGPNHEAWDNSLKRIIEEVRDEIPFVVFEDSVQGKIASEAIRQAEYTLSVLKYTTMPDLSFVGSATLNANNTDNYFGAFGSMTNSDYFLGFKFSYPIGDRANRAKVEQSKNAIYSVQAEYEQTKRDYLTQLNSIIDNFYVSIDLIKGKRAQIEALNSRLTTQLRKLQTGRIEADDIISTRLDLVNTQKDLLNLEYQLVTTAFDYLALVGDSLIERR